MKRWVMLGALHFLVGCTGGGNTSSSSSNGGAASAWAEWPLPPLHPTAYTVTNDTVTDTLTGLVWQRMVPATTFTLSEAKSYCAGLSLGGQTGWRLPMRIELVSILDYTASNPAINTTAFPGTPGESFWSASPFAYNVDYAWYFDFHKGETSSGERYRRVRCVR